MKNNINSKNIICIILAIVLLFATKVYAANDSFQTTLSTNKSSIKRAETVTVTIGLRNISIESGEKGIGAYTAKLDYDTSVLEYQSSNGTNKWEAPLLQGNLIVGNTKDGEVVKTEQSIGTITFKVKDNAKLGETTIKLINFSGSTASTDVTANNTTVTINILDKDNGNQGGSGTQAGSGTQTGGGTQTGSGTQTGGASQTENKNPQEDESQVESEIQDENTNNQNTEMDNSSNTNKKEDSQNTETLPQTGNSNTVINILFSLSIIIVIILLIKIRLLNIRIKKMNNRRSSRRNNREN